MAKKIQYEVHDYTGYTVTRIESEFTDGGQVSGSSHVICTTDSLDDANGVAVTLAEKEENAFAVTFQANQAA